MSDAEELGDAVTPGAAQGAVHRLMAERQAVTTAWAAGVHAAGAGFAPWDGDARTQAIAYIRASSTLFGLTRTRCYYAFIEGWRLVEGSVVASVREVTEDLPLQEGEH